MLRLSSSTTIIRTMIFDRIMYFILSIIFIFCFILYIKDQHFIILILAALTFSFACLFYFDEKVNIIRLEIRQQ